MNKLLLTTAVGAILLSTIPSYAVDVIQLINSAQDALNSISTTNAAWPIHQTAVSAADLINDTDNFGSISQTAQSAAAQTAHNVINFGSSVYGVGNYVDAIQSATAAVNVTTLSQLSGQAIQNSADVQKAVNEVTDYSSNGGYGYIPHLEQTATAAANIFTTSYALPNYLNQSETGYQLAQNILSVSTSVTNVTQSASAIANVLSKQ